jgi:catechol 2,3-dioxygenase-like lactoylglutathione lyase family enzyme
MDADDFLGFDHLQVCCPRGAEEEARAFYGAVMGLVEVPKPEALAGRGGCWFRVGAAQGLHVGVLEPFAPSTKAHPAFQLRDRAALDALVARLEAAGCEVDWADVPIADSRCKVHAPFGNLLELLVGTTG